MDTAFFILAKIVGLGLQVETWLALGLALSVVAGILQRRRLSTVSGSTTLIAMVAIAVFPLGELILQPLEAEFSPRQPPGRVDGLVILGGVEVPRTSAFWDQPQMNAAAERLTAAAALAIRHPEARILFSGGSGRLRDAMTGRPALPGVALDFFTSLGIKQDRITWEDQSRNTAENARLSFAVAMPRPGETWVLITSAFHMGRAMGSFETAGWRNVVPYPVDYRTGSFAGGTGWNLAGNLEILNIAIKEMVGRLAYRLVADKVA